MSQPHELESIDLNFVPSADQDGTGTKYEADDGSGVTVFTPLDFENAGFGGAWESVQATLSIGSDRQPA